MNFNFHNHNFSFWEFLYYKLHHLVFHRRLKNQKKFDQKFIISIGNLTTGGTGKTPLTIFLAEFFLKLNKKILICLRGYKGKFKGELLVAENGKILTNAEISGDEAFLISYKLINKNYKNFKVACGSKRDLLIKKFGTDCDIILLDDAFQNPKIYRNIDIVLIDTSDHPKNIKLLPLGKFREPLKALNRAHIIILTKTNQNKENTKLWMETIRDYHKPIFLSNHIFAGINPKIEEKKIIAVCGIGNPTSFINLLKIHSYEIIHEFIYKDHHRFTNTEIHNWMKYNLPIVTTEKDWVRLLENEIFLNNKHRFYYVNLEVEIIQEKKFYEYISNIMIK